MQPCSPVVETFQVGFLCLQPLGGKLLQLPNLKVLFREVGRTSLVEVIQDQLGMQTLLSSSTGRVVLRDGGLAWGPLKPCHLNKYLPVNVNVTGENS